MELKNKNNNVIYWSDPYTKLNFVKSNNKLSYIRLINKPINEDSIEIVDIKKLIKIDKSLYKINLKKMRIEFNNKSNIKSYKNLKISSYQYYVDKSKLVFI